MSLPVYQNTIVNDRGDVLPEALLRVRTDPGQSNVILYKDRDAADVLTNVGDVYADINGFVRFYLPPGVYRMHVIASGYERTYRHVQVAPLNEYNVVAGEQYALAITDAGNNIQFISDNPVSVEIPTDEDVEFPMWSEITLIQAGEGIITLSGDVTIQNPGGEPVTSMGKGSSIKLTLIGGNVWLARVAFDRIIDGDIEQTGTTHIRGQLDVDGLRLDGNTISSDRGILEIGVGSDHTGSTTVFSAGGEVLTLSNPDGNDVLASTPDTTELSAGGHSVFRANPSLVTVSAPLPGIAGNVMSFSPASVTFNNINGDLVFASNATSMALFYGSNKNALAAGDTYTALFYNGSPIIDVNNSGTNILGGNSQRIQLQNDSEVDGDFEVSGDTVLHGNLHVKGTATIIDSTEVDIGDNIIRLNANETGQPTLSAGFEVERGLQANVSFLWDEFNKRWTTGGQSLHISNLIATGSATIGSQTVSATAIQNWNTAYGWGDYRQFGLGDKASFSTTASIGAGGSWVRLCTVVVAPDRRWSIKLSGGGGYSSGGTPSGTADIQLTGGNGSGDDNLLSVCYVDGPVSGTGSAVNGLFVKSTNGTRDGEWEVWISAPAFSRYAVQINASHNASFSIDGLTRQTEKPTADAGFGYDKEIRYRWTSANLPNIQSATPANGGLLVDNQKTGTGLERVLTESDLGSGIDTSTTMFESPHFLTITDQDAHRGLHGAVIPLENKWIIVWREASLHGYDASGVLKVADTVNQGRTLTNIRTIYSEPAVDVMHPAVAVMANGRIGMIVARILAQGSPPGSPAFVYSDDGGETWNSRVLTGVTGVASQDFMHRYPSSAGGDDSQGFWMSGYVGFQGEDLHAVYTTDNGDTWSSAVIVESSSNDFLSESTVTRLGDSNRWVMVVRRNTDPVTGTASDSTTASFYQSTDMMQWDGPYDTQQVLGRNPPHIVYKDGRVEWFAFSRKFIGRPIPIDGHDTDSLIWQSADAEVLWETRQGWSGWEIVTPLREPVGYLNTFKADGQWFAIFAHNENRPGLYCQLAIMSQREIFDDPGITIDSVQPVTVSPAAEIRETKVSAKTGTLQSINAGASRTIFDIDGAVELLGGIISGPPDGEVTLVVDGSLVFGDAGLPFDDSAGNQSMVFPFYPIKSRKHMSLELRNAGSTAGRYSWRIYLREPNTTNTASELV